MPDDGRDADIATDLDRFQELLVADETEFCDLLGCVLEIAEPTAEAYRHVLTTPDATVQELADAMESDPSTVNRRLGTLREKELVTRHRSLLDGGGVVYRYQPASVDQVEERMHRTLDAWTAAKHEQIEDLLTGTDQGP